MSDKILPTKKSLKKSTIEKTGQIYHLPKQNQISLDYFQKKKLYDEQIFEPLRHKIFTVKQHLPNKKFNYYIFTGPQNYEISSILKKIQVSINNHSLNLELSDKKKLISAFGDNYKQVLGLYLKDYHEFQYIFMLIEEEDTIENIKKKINVYINPNISVNTQYLWINFDSNNRLINHKIHKYLMRISNDKQIYLSTLVSSLLSISGHKCTPSSLGFSDDKSTITFSEFEEIKSLSKYINFSHETLGFTYNDNSNFGLINPFDDHNSQKFESIPLDKRKYILLNYGEIENNLINLVVYKDFNQKNPDYKNISKYWPYLKNPFTIDLDSERKIFENISKITNYIYLNSQSPKINFKSHNFQQVIININSFDEISKSVEKEDFINLDKIFDTIDLSYEYPFVRYNEGLLDNMKYKLYKPITKIGKNGRSFIDKDKIIQWSNIKKKGKMKRGIHIYQLFGQKEQENEFQKVSLSTDGKIELRVTWKNIKANYVDLERAVEKSKQLILYLNNNINYNVKINSDDKIKIPSTVINDYNNLTTEISSINCLMTIQTQQSIDISSLFEYCREYLYNFVSIEIKKENNVDKGLILRYKRIDNFKTDNVVYTFLEQNYKNSNSRDIDIINKINELYRVGKEKAMLILNDYKKKTSYESYNNQFKRNMKAKSDGYHIQINKQFNKLFKISMSIKNPEHLKYIINFLKTLFSLVIEKKVLELENINESNDVDKLIESVNSSLSSDNSDNLLSEIDDEDDIFLEDSATEMDMDYHTELTPEIIKQKDSDGEFEKKKKEAVQIDSRYIINRLKEHDNKIFNFSKGNSTVLKKYTRMCQGNEGRQPIVITQKEKDNIDKKFKGSYSEALKYSSDPSKDNYYICPYIWCAKCNVSLRPKDVKKNKNESMSCPLCGGVPFDNSKKSRSNGTLFIKKQNFWTAKWESEFPSNDKWKQMYPSFLDPKKKNENDFCLPCCFKNKNTPRDILSKEICLNNKVIKTKKNDKFEKYVSGWKKFPLDENRLGLLPSILNDILENDLKEAFGDGEGGNLQDDVPIFLRKGISNSLPDSFINSVISLSRDSNNTEHTTLSLNINDICNKITVEIFVSVNDGDLISIFYDHRPLDKDVFKKFYEWISERRVELKHFIDYKLLERVKNIDTMNSLQDEIKYTFLKIYEIYNSFNNFIDYLKSNKIKDEQLLWELLSKKGIIFDDDVNLIIFENINDRIYQMCPKWFNDEYIKFDKDTCLLYKQSNRFEPIFNTMGHNTDKIVARHYMGRLDDNNDLVEIENGQKILLYSIKSIEFIMGNAHNFCLEIENNNYKKHMVKKNYLYSHKSKQIYDCLTSIKYKNYHPFYQIVNDNFKSVAFIINDIDNCHSKSSKLQNKILVPFIPSRVINNIPIIFGMHHYIPNKYQTTVKTLLDIERITKDNLDFHGDFIITPKERIINNEHKTYLINTETNYLIPVKEEKINDRYPVIMGNLDINLDYKINKFKKIHDIREIEMAKYKLENNLFEQFRFEISKIISHSIKGRKTEQNISHKVNKDEDLIDFENGLVTFINSPLISNSDKKKFLKEIINIIIEESDSFYFDDHNSIDIHQDFNQKTRRLCSFNKLSRKCHMSNLCIWNKDKCKLYIPKHNLVYPKIDNKERYIDTLAEDIIRNNIKKNEIINGTVSEIINNSISPNEIIITEDNFEIEIDKIYSHNNHILYNKTYPEKGYDNYFIDNKFIKKPIPNSSLKIMKDSYIYYDLPRISNHKDISIESLVLIANEKDIDIKEKLLKHILSNDYVHFLSKYHSCNFKDYKFIKDRQSFKDYFMNEHYLNVVDIEVFSKVYKQNIIVIYEFIYNYIEFFKNNKTNKYYIILITDTFEGKEKKILFYSVALEDTILFDYENFSYGLKKLMKESQNSNLLIQSNDLTDSPRRTLKRSLIHKKETKRKKSLHAKKSISKNQLTNKKNTNKK